MKILCKIGLHWPLKDTGKKIMYDPVNNKDVTLRKCSCGITWAATSNFELGCMNHDEFTKEFEEKYGAGEG